MPRLRRRGVIAVGLGLRCAGPFAGHRDAGDSWRDRAGCAARVAAGRCAPRATPAARGSVDAAKPLTPLVSDSDARPRVLRPSPPRGRGSGRRRVGMKRLYGSGGNSRTAAATAQTHGCGCVTRRCVARAMLTSSFAYQAAEKLSRAGLNLFSRMGFGHTYGNSLN